MWRVQGRFMNSSVVSRTRFEINTGQKSNVVRAKKTGITFFI